MSSKTAIGRVKAAASAYAAATDALDRLDAARRAREAAEELEAAAIHAARKAGATWSSIGDLYGLTKQGAQQRFRPAADDTPSRGRAAKKPRHRG
jgi:hypothetical protein